MLPLAWIRPTANKIVELGVEDVEIEKGTLVGVEDEIVVEEGNGDLVAGGEHDEIGLDLAAVAEADLVPGELGDFGLHPDAAVAGRVAAAPCSWSGGCP